MLMLIEPIVYLAQENERLRCWANRRKSPACRASILGLAHCQKSPGLPLEFLSLLVDTLVASRRNLKLGSNGKII